MSNILFVVNSTSRWDLNIAGVNIVSAQQYLTDPSLAALRYVRVYNLCRSYRYQTLGYYVSLLAEARGHKPVPRVGTVQDMKSQAVIRGVSSELDDTIQRSLRHLQSQEFELSVYFAKNVARRYDHLSRSIFNLFPVPLLRAFFKRVEDRWQLMNVSAISMNEIPSEHREYIPELVQQHFAQRTSERRRLPRFYMGILTDPKDPTPPSDEKALQRFEKAARRQGFAVERLQPDDYGRVGEFDALFIRQTTAVNNSTYRFASRAEADGVVVIDDPVSIVRCTNKVYLAELFKRHHIPCPRTLILHKDNISEVRSALAIPCILKQPDSAFSLGVWKADTENEFADLCDQLLQKSDLMIAQEFIPTNFDWRVGILDGRPFYACKYFMARGHWQIYNSERSGRGFSGTFETVPIELVPMPVVRAAVKAAQPIGSGLYGVDLKEVDGKAYVIEVNDNPSLEAGVEDKLLKDRLYETIVESFVRRIEHGRDRGKWG